MNNSAQNCFLRNLPKAENKNVNWSLVEVGNASAMSSSLFYWTYTLLPVFEFLEDIPQLASITSMLTTQLSLRRYHSLQLFGFLCIGDWGEYLCNVSSLLVKVLWAGPALSSNSWRHPWVCLYHHKAQYSTVMTLSITQDFRILTQMVVGRR